MRLAGRDFEQLLRVTPGLGIRRRWRAMRKPDEVVVHGVWVPLGPRWATDVIRKALYDGWYERPLVDILRRTLRPGERYMEVGAGLGVVTTVACQLTGDHNVTVFEANPELIAIVRETAAANAFHPEVVHAAVGDEIGELPFYIHADFWASSMDGAYGGEAITIEGRSFDAELERVRPNYLLLDAEGAELSLLMERTLPEHVRAICMEVHPDVVGTQRTSELIAHLCAQGYSIDLTLSGLSTAYLVRAES